MDIIDKLPDDIANKIYLMVGEHPCARMINELKNKYQFDHDFNLIDEHFMHDFKFYDSEKRTNYCSAPGGGEPSDFLRKSSGDNYNLFAITHFTVRLINFNESIHYLPASYRKYFSKIYSIDQSEELFTIITTNRDKISRIIFRSEFGIHRIYHNKYGHSYFEFDNYVEIYEDATWSVYTMFWICSMYFIFYLLILYSFRWLRHIVIYLYECVIHRTKIYEHLNEYLEGMYDEFFIIS